MNESHDKADYPDIRQAVWLLVCLLFIWLLITIPFFLIEFGIDYPLLEHPACQAAITALAFGIALKWGIGKTGRSFWEVCPIASFKRSLYPLMALLVLGLEILLSETDNIMRTLYPAPQWLMDQLLDLIKGERSLWGSVLALVIVAPLAEEFLFRGLILDGFLRRYSVAKSIYVSALLFAIYHLNPWQFIGALAGGAILAWWRVNTGSIVPCIFGHALKNAIPMIVVGMNIEIRGYSSDPAGAVQMHPWWFDVTGIILFVTAFFFLQQQFTDPARANEV